MAADGSLNDSLRGAYNEFIKSPVGEDFLKTLVAYEQDLYIQAMRADDPYKKAALVDKMGGIYWVRTRLADNAKPKSNPANRSNTIDRSNTTTTVGSTRQPS